MVPVAALTLREVRQRRELPFALLPATFALHQFLEVFVWAGLDGDVPAGLAEWAMRAYLFIAWPLLPTYVPLAVMLLEPKSARLRVAPFLALGVVVSAYLAYVVLDIKASAADPGNDAQVAAKFKAAQAAGLVPMLCVGETLAEREAGRAEEVLAAQTRGALAKLDARKKAAEILLAYEPVWAIGDKGIPATSDYADHQQMLIKRAAAAVLGREPQVLYGGSVNPGNAAELVGCPHVDGLFIGRSAWAPEGYIDILNRVVATL